MSTAVDPRSTVETAFAADAMYKLSMAQERLGRRDYDVAMQIVHDALMNLARAWAEKVAQDGEG